MPRLGVIVQIVLLLILLSPRTAVAAEPVYATVVDKPVLGAGLLDSGKVWILAYTGYAEPETQGCIAFSACATLLLADREADEVFARVRWPVGRNVQAFGLGEDRVGVVFQAAGTDLPQSHVDAFEPFPSALQYFAVVDASTGFVLHSTYLPEGFYVAHGAGIGSDIILFGTQLACATGCGPDSRALRVMRFDADLRVVRFDRADYLAGAPLSVLADGATIHLLALIATATPGAAVSEPSFPQGGLGLVGVNAADGALRFRSHIGRLNNPGLRRDPFARGVWVYGSISTDGFPVTSHAAFRRCGDLQGCRTSEPLAAFGGQVVYSPADVAIALFSGDGSRIEYATYAGVDGSAMPVGLIPDRDRVRLLVGTAAPQVSFSAVERKLETFDFALDRPLREALGPSAWASGLQHNVSFDRGGDTSHAAVLLRQTERTPLDVLRGSNGLDPECVDDGTAAAPRWCQLIAMWPSTSQGSAAVAIPVLTSRGSLLLVVLMALLAWHVAAPVLGVLRAQAPQRLRRNG